MKGWKHESARHSLAARGIGTRRSPRKHQPVQKRKSLESVFGKRDPFWIVENATHREIELHEQGIKEPMTIYEGKNIVQCGYLEDLAQLGSELEILNPVRGDQVCRVVTIEGDDVRIAIPGADPPSIVVPGNTPVFYEEWFLDRGSYLFWNDKFNDWLKLATEFDPVRVVKE